MAVLYKNGGSSKSKINIKKSHEGSFTEYCNGHVTDACILKAKRSGNKKLVKKAVFAENARKWKHKNGGVLYAKAGSIFLYKRNSKGQMAWYNSRTGKFINFGNRIRNTDGSYVLLNSDGTATKLYDPKTGKFATLSGRALTEGDKKAMKEGRTYLGDGKWSDIGWKPDDLYTMSFKGSNYKLTTDQVKLLQEQLNKYGANLVVDGLWGPLTRKAYRLYFPNKPMVNPDLNSPFEFIEKRWVKQPTKADDKIEVRETYSNKHLPRLLGIVNKATLAPVDTENPQNSRRLFYSNGRNFRRVKTIPNGFSLNSNNGAIYDKNRYTVGYSTNVYDPSLGKDVQLFYTIDEKRVPNPDLSFFTFN